MSPEQREKIEYALESMQRALMIEKNQYSRLKPYEGFKIAQVDANIRWITEELLKLKGKLKSKKKVSRPTDPFTV